MPLAPRTTFELGGAARWFVQANDDATLVDALRFAAEKQLAVAILGGGSNVVVSDAGFDGLVIGLGQRGVELSVRGSSAWLTVAAGEPWDEIVGRSVERDLAGLECLSGIPGLTGAAPIQNVGAYGQEVAETIASVRVLDRVSLRECELSSAECGFRYRDSAFKRDPSRCVVLSVTFVLRLGGEPSIAYPELARALAPGGATPSLRAVREAVLALRRSKSMLREVDDENRRSAGSFFTNPIVSAADAERIAREAVAAGLCTQAEDMPRYPAPGGNVKLAAGWLIERAGVHKGERRGAVGVSSRHALALVQHGGASSAELVAFARDVRSRVHAKFGVLLTPEPAFLGFGEGFCL